ncbi:hypothetical protein [Laspinema olomoucense]|uniref:Uncharacterized protein n=1 Tax=Laspinema olomoucense D3b TaxID=2953688 RepID=A0ABT2N4S0_9CYAN|nr:hypothetical protein [Laspinema sp. D3b]MCT7976385.1 hypothetical protein [Laspinema sp. D3b]
MLPLEFARFPIAGPILAGFARWLALSPASLLKSHYSLVIIIAIFWVILRLEFIAVLFAKNLRVISPILGFYCLIFEL